MRMRREGTTLLLLAAHNRSTARVVLVEPDLVQGTISSIAAHGVGVGVWKEGKEKKGGNRLGVGVGVGCGCGCGCGYTQQPYLWCSWESC